MNYKSIFNTAAKTAFLAHMSAVFALHIAAAFPESYSIDASTWLVQHDLPAATLDGAGKIMPIRIYDDSLMARIAGYDIRYRGYLLDQYPNMPEIFRRVVYAAGAPYTAVKAAFRLPLGKAASSSEGMAFIIHDINFVMIGGHDFRDSLEMLFSLTEADKKLADYFVLAHELRHTSQPVGMDDDLLQLSKEADADLYALECINTHFPGSRLGDIIKYYRAYAGFSLHRDKEADYTHSSALYIDAAQKGQPLPDAKDVMKASHEMTEAMEMSLALQNGLISDEELNDFRRNLSPLTHRYLAIMVEAVEYGETLKKTATPEFLAPPKP